MVDRNHFPFGEGGGGEALPYLILVGDFYPVDPLSFTPFDPVGSILQARLDPIDSLVNLT